MQIAAFTMAAAMSLGQVYVGGLCPGEERLLVTPPPYPGNMVDDVHRPGFNGRYYLRRPVIGGMAGPYALARSEQGAEAYGAFGSESEVVWARVNHQPIALDPFTRLPSGMVLQERARELWLRQHGYTGGVRTHVNDLYVFDGDESEEMASKPTPRATIQVPESWRRTPTLEVRREVRPAVRFEEVAGQAVAIDMRPAVRLEETKVADAE